jgi:hypothetical protein
MLTNWLTLTSPAALSVHATHPPTKCAHAGRCSCIAQVIAEAVRGTANALHSRARRVLDPLTSRSLWTAHESLETVAAEVLACAVDKICIPLRRGGGQLLWDALHDGASVALDSVHSAATATTQQQDGAKKAAKGKRPAAATAVDGLGARQWAARMVACICHAVEFYRGSRVEHFGPLFELAQRLLRGLAAATAAEQSAAADAEVSSFHLPFQANHFLVSH